jgi:PAS domain S-box-containing protein
METREVVGLVNHCLLLARDGGEHHISDSAAPIRDSDHQIIGVVLVFSDVTEAYRARQALAATTEMLERTSTMVRVGG